MAESWQYELLCDSWWGWCEVMHFIIQNRVTWPENQCADCCISIRTKFHINFHHIPEKNIFLNKGSFLSNPNSSLWGLLYFLYHLYVFVIHVLLHSKKVHSVLDFLLTQGGVRKFGLSVAIPWVNLEVCVFHALLCWLGKTYLLWFTFAV